MLFGNASSYESDASSSGTEASSITPPSISPLSSISSSPVHNSSNASFIEDDTTEQNEPNFLSAFDGNLEPLPLHQVSQWQGFKIVSDNIDKNVTPSFQRLDKTKKSFHYVHSYAVKDRIDMSALSDDLPVAREHLASDLLPSAEDLACLKSEFRILLTR